MWWRGVFLVRQRLPILTVRALQCSITKIVRTPIYVRSYALRIRQGKMCRRGIFQGVSHASTQVGGAQPPKNFGITTYVDTVWARATTFGMVTQVRKRYVSRGEQRRLPMLGPRPRGGSQRSKKCWIYVY